MSRQHRTKIFVSYSHQDQPWLEALEPFLKSLKDRGLLECWSDQGLEPGDRWHEEIQAAIEQSAAALLLVSQPFLASDYIREHELPPLLRGRERDGVKIACLFVSPSLADHEGMTFSGAGAEPVRLTDYQGINDPNRPLTAMDEHERAETCKKAAEWLARAAPRAGGGREFRQPRSEGRRELTVAFTAGRSRLTRVYASAGIKITEARGPWEPRRLAAAGMRNASQIGHELFTLLFPDDRTLDEILEALFEPAAGVRPSPVYAPVRVRIATDDSLLSGLPWHLTAWKDRRLWDSAGWTFELAKPARDLPDCLLRAPCPVLLIGAAEGAGGHLRAVEELLHRAWPGYTEPPRRARTVQDIESAMRERRPPIVYAVLEGPDAAVADGPSRRLLPELLRGAWGTRPPQVLFINQLHGGPAEATDALAALHPDVPLIVHQSAADPAALQESALGWLHAVLECGEDADPVCALHEYGVVHASVWAAYGRWRQRTQAAPPKEALARLLLDRKMQRASVRGAVDELLQYGDRRVCCLLAYGAEGNMVDLLAQQLLEHLRRTTHGMTQIVPLKLRLPEGMADFDRGAAVAQMRKDLALGPRGCIREALGRRRPRVGKGARPILFLDWGVRGDAREPIDRAGLRAWVELCAEVLCAECPEDLRLLSLLALESPEAKHGRIAELADEIRGDPRFRDATFRLERLEPLGAVIANDLADFLERREHASCPPNLLDDMPELVVRDTGGRFEPTVALIEEAERTSWYALHDRLVAKGEVERPAPVDPGGTL